MAVLDLLAVYLAAQRKTISAEEAGRLTAAIAALPAQVEQILSSREQIQYYASQYFNHDSVFFIGRNLDYALGMEGSLKLKEISYIPKPMLRANLSTGRFHLLSRARS